MTKELFGLGQWCILTDKICNIWYILSCMDIEELVNKASDQ